MVHIHLQHAAQPVWIADQKHSGLSRTHGYGKLNIAVIATSNSWHTTSKVIYKHKKTRKNSIILLYLKSYALYSIGLFPHFMFLSTR